MKFEKKTEYLCLVNCLFSFEIYMFIVNPVTKNNLKVNSKYIYKTFNANLKLKKTDFLEEKN